MEDTVIGTSDDSVYIFRLESRSSSPLQTDAKGKGWKWSSLMTPSRLSHWSGASWTFIHLENEQRFILKLLLCHIPFYFPFGSPLCTFTLLQIYFQWHGALDYHTACVFDLFLWFFPWPLFYRNSWDREAIQLLQTLMPKETGRLAAAADSQPQNELLVNWNSCLSYPCWGIVETWIFVCIQGFLISNFYSLKVLFIADAKISFDSFRSGMTATVNSKTIITVNPGKMFPTLKLLVKQLWCIEVFLLCKSSIFSEENIS